MPAPKVELADDSSQQVITATANDEGMLHFNHLSPRTYKLTVTFPGFDPYFLRLRRKGWERHLRTTTAAASTPHPRQNKCRGMT